MPNPLQRLLGIPFYNEVCQTVPECELTEIRLRQGKAVVAKNLNRHFFVQTKTATSELILGIMERATNHSFYAYEQELASGYLFYDGGIRIGASGIGVAESGKLKTFKEITSLNIRVPHEIIGCSDKVSSVLTDFSNTLVISPPGAGKTTLIRDMARVLAKTFDVLIIDERYEIAGGGQVHFDVGKMTDVISGVRKEAVFEGAIRSMSPQIIVFDEIFPSRDLATIAEISRCGIAVLASVHSKGHKQLITACPELIKHFDYLIVLASKPTIGSIKSILEVRNGEY